MSSNSILKSYETSLRDYSDRQVIVSAATPLELSKRDGIKYATFAIKIGNSDVPAYYEDNRALDEAQFMDITSFVDTSGSHTERDNRYQLMLDMTDQVRGWARTLDNVTISGDIHWTKYIGVVNTIDDQQGFYAMIQRLQFEADQQLYS